MALRQILITRKLAELEAEQKELQSKIGAVAARRSTWQTREAAAVAALDEINGETSEEDRKAFETETAEIEAEDKAISEEEAANTERSSAIDAEINNLKNELNDIEKRAKQSEKKPTEANITIQRGDTYMDKFTPEYRSRIAQYCERDDVKTFVENARGIMRGVSNANLTVPSVLLPAIRERISTYSKLLPVVTLKAIRGEGKQNIIGSAPEAVWTDALGKFNELSFDVAQITVDGEKVAGYIPVPNPYIQDSDEDLAALVTDMLGQAIGRAIDKAIIYGTGANMPVGIIPRLVATAAPTWWGTKAPAFTNLSATHVGKQSATSVKEAALVKEMLKVLATTKPLYNMGDETRTWIMNPTTWASIKIDTLNNDAAGALVAGMQNTMPVLGGKVIELDFMPDNVVVGGYMGHYLLGERHGVELRKSEHVKFIEDETVFAGVARYDGRPVAGEAFAAFSLTTTAVSGTAVTFAADSANAVSDS